MKKISKKNVVLSRKKCKENPQGQCISNVVFRQRTVIIVV